MTETPCLIPPISMTSLAACACDCCPNACLSYFLSLRFSRCSSFYYFLAALRSFVSPYSPSSSSCSAKAWSAAMGDAGGQSLNYCAGGLSLSCWTLVNGVLPGAAFFSFWIVISSARGIRPSTGTLNCLCSSIFILWLGLTRRYVLITPGWLSVFVYVERIVSASQASSSLLSSLYTSSPIVSVASSKNTVAKASFFSLSFYLTSSGSSPSNRSSAWTSSDASVFGMRLRYCCLSPPKSLAKSKNRFFVSSMNSSQAPSSTFWVILSLAMTSSS